MRHPCAPGTAAGYVESVYENALAVEKVVLELKAASNVLGQHTHSY